MAARNRLIVPGAQEAVDQLKIEIANELGVNFGRKATAEDRCRYLYLSSFAQGCDECPPQREYHYYW